MVPIRAIGIVLPRVSDRFPERVEIARAMDDWLAPVRLGNVDVFYQAETDTALLRVRVRAERLTGRFVATLDAQARALGAYLVGAGVSRGGALDAMASQLGAYEVCFSDAPTAGGAMELLGHHLGELETRSVTDDELVRYAAAGLRVRFRRGDVWQVGRVRNLSTATIAVATSSPPRRGDVVEIEVGFGADEALLWGQVLAVTPPDAAEVMGAGGFSARFVAGEPEEQRRFQQLVAEAERAGRASRQPPRRRDSRYPVRWSVEIGVGGAARGYAALDLSRHGMFIATGTSVPVDTPVEVTIPFEASEETVYARGRVARTITGPTAASKKVRPGFGVELTSMREDDERRYFELVDRVAARTSRFVVVAAEPGRLPRLSSALSAVGYATAGADSVQALVDKAFARSREPDLLVLDSSFESGDPAALASLHSAMRSRPTRVVHLDGASPRDAIWQVDAALLGFGEE